jgi:hypothetical protein
MPHQYNAPSFYFKKAFMRALAIFTSGKNFARLGLGFMP